MLDTELKVLPLTIASGAENKNQKETVKYVSHLILTLMLQEANFVHYKNDAKKLKND